MLKSEFNPAISYQNGMLKSEFNPAISYQNGLLKSEFNTGVSNQNGNVIMISLYKQCTCIYMLKRVNMFKTLYTEAIIIT